MSTSTFRQRLVSALGALVLAVIANAPYEAAATVQSVYAAVESHAAAWRALRADAVHPYAARHEGVIT